MDILDDEVLKRLATDTSRGRFPVLIAAFLKEIEKCTEQLNAAVSERDEGKVREIAHFQGHLVPRAFMSHQRVSNRLRLKKRLVTIWL